MATLDINKEVAETILKQLGARKFIAMTGAKDFMVLPNGLRFKIGRNATSTNTVTINLNGNDLYDMKFERVSLSKKTWDVKKKMINESKDIFAEDMPSIFTQVTGLYTRLF
jgi:hypothetical protein